MLNIEYDWQGHVRLTGPGSTITVTAQATVAFDFNPTISAERMPSCPYPGLHPFDVHQAPYLFGRQTLIHQLWEKFRQLHLPPAHQKRTLRLLPVFGPKAIGKSSIVRAGLLPELARQPLNGLAHLHVLIMQPGANPLATLSTLLARVIRREPQPSAKTAMVNFELTTPEGLSQLMPEVLDNHHEHLILCIDQFEELYTVCQDEEIRRLFIDNLLLAAADPASNCSVILTLDSHFLPTIQQHRLLYQTCARQGMLVTMLRPEEVREAVVEPARQAGQPLPAALVEQVFTQFKHLGGDALPCLQFTLVQLWRQLRQVITVDDPLGAIGGVQGALEHRLQVAYDSLPPDQQARFWRILPRLMRLDVYGQLVCPVETIEHLARRPDRQHEVLSILQVFAQADVQFVRLTQTYQAISVQISSPVVANYWSLLRQWQRQQCAQSVLHHYIRQSTQQWEQWQRPPGLLWDRDQLALLRHQSGGFWQRLTALQLTFIETAQRRQHYWQSLRYGLLGLFSVLLLGFVVEVHQLTLQVGEQRAAQEAALQYAEQMKQDRDAALEQTFKTQLTEQLLREELGKARSQLAQAQAAEEMARRALDDFLEARLNGKKPSKRLLTRQCELFCTDLNPSKETQAAPSTTVSSITPEPKPPPAVTPLPAAATARGTLF